MPKDRKPQGRARTGGGRPSAAGSGGGTTRSGAARRGGRPTTTVVAGQRPWGLIAGAVAVVVFAAAVIVYAVVQVNHANANKASSPSDIRGLQTFDYSAGQQHVTTPVDYKQSPPVGGPHDPYWADCTGTVYSVDIRHENAVHGLEHGGVWITYNPDTLAKADVATLAKLVDGKPGMFMSPYAGLDSPISIQSWNHQLKLQKATDPRLKEFADFFALNPTYYPEVGASCENPDFKAHPIVEGQPSQAVGSSMAPGGTGQAPAGESSAPATGSAP